MTVNYKIMFTNKKNEYTDDQITNIRKWIFVIALIAVAILVIP